MDAENAQQQETKQTGRQGGDLEPNIVFVGNLDYKTSWQELKDVFRKAGAVRFADLIAANDGRPKGSALITFEDAEGADAAIKMFHDTELDGRPISVRRFEAGRKPTFVRDNQQPRGRKFDGERPPRNAGVDNQEGEQDDTPNRVFVGNLDYKTSWQKLKDVFRKAGAVRFSDLIAAHDGRPKGSALITFEDEAGAANAIKMFHDTELDGRKISVRLFESGRRPAFVRHQMQPRDRDRRDNGDNVPPPAPRSQQGSDRKVVVSNLPFECTSQSLRDTFGQVGQVVDANVITRPNGRSTGKGVVEFASRREAEGAVREFDGIEMAGRPMKVEAQV